MSNLKSFYDPKLIEAGCDEAGRGCLAGPVCAAAVVFPKGYKNKMINDSKQLSESRRNELRKIIENESKSWSVAMIHNEEIDKLNILKASIMAMHKALDGLELTPEKLLIDGNKFIQYKKIPHHCMIKGDARFLSIAAASILAKTYRDEYMAKLHEEYPDYAWDRNKGYPTRQHREAITVHGITKFHRKSFRLIPEQLSLEL